ncbi:MAG: tetratricopeptide repeat protein [Chthoniobacterales bacterium]
MHAISERRALSRARACVYALVLAGVTVCAYQPAWRGGFIWDDDAYVVNNELLTAADGLRRIWFSFDSPSQYFPLVYTTFRVERALWGLNPTGYHWTNLILHVANALLLWRLLAKLKVSGAALAAAFFALHPVQVESVAWITERKNVLMGFFFLLASLGWIAFVDSAQKRRWLFYGLALSCYALALSAKTTACTLPAALLLALWWQKKSINWQRLLQVAPFVLLGLAMGILTIWWERYHQGTSRAIFPFLGPVERVLVASRAGWFYLWKLIWPANLTFIYPRWQIAPADPLSYGWVLACVGTCALIYLGRQRLGRGVAVAALFFIATLAPVLGFIMLYTFRYTFVADHYQYLACIGPIALISAGWTTLAAATRYSCRLAYGAGLLVAMVLALLTWQQSRMYANIEALWRTTLAANPDCWMAHNNLGIVLFQKGQLDEAISHYRTTLQLQPTFGDAEYNLGNALLGKGEIDQALVHCEKALTLQPNDPDTHVALANALLESGRRDEAIAHYQRALAIRPSYFLAHYGLGRAFLEKGEFRAAIPHCQTAVSIQPNHADAHAVLAIAFDQNGRIADAISEYQKALEISPQSIPAANNLAWLLATAPDGTLRRGDKALELARRADQLSGRRNPTVLRTLAAAHAENGHFGEAVEIARAALQLANSADDRELAVDLQQDLSFYRAGFPYRELLR